MIRRVCALLLVLAWAGQSAASLHACVMDARAFGTETGGAGREPPSHPHGGGGVHTGAARPMIGGAHADHPAIGGPTPGAASATDAMPGHCNRHHPGPCPHGAAIHPCQSGSATAVQAVFPGLPHEPARPPLLAGTVLPPRPLATPAALEIVSSPEIPPPRAF